MRKYVILLLVLCSAFITAGNVTISLNDKPIIELFSILKKDGKLQLVYSRECLYRNGRLLTINMDLQNVAPELALELAAKATGFQIENHNGVYVVLPVADTASAADPAAKPQVPRPAPFTVTETPRPKPAPAGEGAVEVIGLAGAEENTLAGQRYTGNFMYGQGNKIYLNLVIPAVNEDEEKRITAEMAKSLADKELTKAEVCRLFGNGTEVGGIDLKDFLKPLSKAIAQALNDGGLDTAEINKLRNDFINGIISHYEGM